MNRIAIPLAFLGLLLCRAAAAEDARVYRNDVYAVSIPAGMSYDIGADDGFEELFLYFTGDERLSRGTISIFKRRSRERLSLSRSWEPIRDAAVAGKRVAEEKDRLIAGVPWRSVVFSGPIGCCIVKEALFYTVHKEGTELKMHYDCTGGNCPDIEKRFLSVTESLAFR